MMQRSLLLLIVLFVFSLEALESAAATRFVRSTDGTDAGNACLVESSPCRTIQHAYDSAAAGDEIWIAGDFDESVSTTFPVSFVGRSRFVLPPTGTAFGLCAGETGINRCPRWTTSSSSAPALLLDPGALQATRVEHVRFVDVSGRAAVQVESGSIQILDALFRNNRNTGGGLRPGGALSIAGANGVTIERSIFEENRDASSGALAGGGAISSFAPLVVSDSTFARNEAEFGGALFCGAGQLDVTNSVFDQNVASEAGGAIRMEFITPATIRDGTFRFNEAGSEGGAVSALVSALEVSGTTLFQENRVDVDPSLGSGGGGAVSVAGLTTRIDGATFLGNVIESANSEAAGAALVASSNGSVTITDTRFEENVEGATGSAREVGIVAATGGADLDLRSSLFANAGVSADGTALVLDASTLTMRDSEVHDYAGGIYLETLSGLATPSEVEVLRSTLAAHATNVSVRTATNVQPHEVRFFNATLSGASAANVDVGEAGIFEFVFTTLADGTAFDFSAFAPASTLQVAVRDSIVDGDCVFGGAPFAGPTLALGTRWSDASCGAGSGLVPNLGLLPLADNGGPTETHFLTPASPAIDAGALRCLTAPIDALDQRGVTRPEGACDAGAVEVPEPGFRLGLLIASIGLTAAGGRTRRGGRPSAARRLSAS
ncbi:MAG: choice-of-anchor Q domain-containing protein [Myxococcota bacterium]